MVPLSHNPTLQSMPPQFESILFQLDLCRGHLCPERPIPGLVVIHAWTPSKMNRITADHVAYNFLTLEDDTETHPHFTPNIPYVLKEFGELGIGEKHVILPNNSLAINPNKNQHMIMTVEDEMFYCGMVFDGIGRSNECPNHHSVIYR